MESVNRQILTADGADFMDGRYGPAAKDEMTTSAHLA